MRPVGALIALAFCATSTLGLTEEYNPVPRPIASPAVSGAVEGILVKFRAAGTESAQERAQAQRMADGASALAARHGFTLRRSRAITSRLHAMQLESISNTSALMEILAVVQADPAVEYAEPDGRRYPHAVPNDPLYANQWYLQNASTTPAAIDAVTAWDTTTGTSSLVIADLDTGVRYDHPDLLTTAAGGRLLPGYNFVSNASVANDGDGRDADASDPGDWLSQADVSSAQFSGCTVGNSSWHGTRTAGILGAATNNSLGVAGITWSGSILPVRVLGKWGGADSDILPAMLWAAGIHVDGVPDNTHPANIENMSLGASGSCPQSYQDVIKQLTARGVLVVASAGNDGGPVSSPANCAGVAGVAGLRHAGTKVGYSSLGPEIALSAPAGNCVNTGSGQPCLYSIDTTTNLGTTTPGASSYTDQSNPNLGTSFSAPIVSAIAGLMLSVNGNLNSAQLIARLQEGATKPFPTTSDTGTPAVCHLPTGASDLQNSECSCTTSTCGAGMANAKGAVLAALRPIAAVTVPTNVAAGQSVVLQGVGSAAACHHTIATYSWAIVSGSAPSGVSGANTATATVVAPSSGTYSIRLTVTDDAGRQDTADVQISPTTANTSAPAIAGTNACTPRSSPAPVTVSISPATATVQAGIGTQAFQATVSNASNTGVTWQVNGTTGGNATVGAISTSGLYTAPANVPSPATVAVTAISVADTSKSASAQVTISAPVAVAMTPASASLQAGSGTQSFTATVSNATNTVVTWSVNGVTGGNTTVGTIATSGLYTAPATTPSPATVTVKATSVADSNRSASAQVTITSPPGGGGGTLDLLTLMASMAAVGWRSCARTRADFG